MMVDCAKAVKVNPRAYVKATTGDYTIKHDSYYVALGDGSAVAGYPEKHANEIGITLNNLAKEGDTVVNAFGVVKSNASDIAKRSNEPSHGAEYDARFPLELARISLGFSFRLLPKTVKRGSVFRHRIQKNICKAVENIQLSKRGIRSVKMNILCIKIPIYSQKTQFVVLVREVLC